MRMLALERRSGFWGLVLLVWAALVFSVSRPAPASAQDIPSRQVTLFGILATPNSSAIDPELKTIAPQLRQLLPGHGFKLLEVQSKRLTAGQSIACAKLQGFVAETALIDPLDINGKVQLRFQLGVKTQQGPADNQTVEVQMATVVSTPPNQLSFFDKPLSDGTRIIIGMGAR
jgi:hypothetical protein